MNKIVQTPRKVNPPDGPDVDSDIEAAALWLRSVTSASVEPRRYIVPELRSRFGLTALEACDAIRLARARP
jgi:hypothetical protein